MHDSASWRPEFTSSATEGFPIGREGWAAAVLQQTDDTHDLTGISVFIFRPTGKIHPPASECKVQSSFRFHRSGEPDPSVIAPASVAQILVLMPLFRLKGLIIGDEMVSGKIKSLIRFMIPT